MSSLVTPEYIADFAVTAGANHTTLNGSYTAASGSMTVTSAAALSTTNQFHFYIADQTTFAVKCIGVATAVSSNTFTVTMSLDANANSGDLVYISLCAGAFRQLQADGCRYGTFASLPATVPPAGAYYKCTDAPYEFISNGSVWQAFYLGYPVTPPSASGWTTEGVAPQSGSQGGYVHYTNGFGSILGNSLNSQSLATQYTAAPGSTPYSFTARMTVDPSGGYASIYYGLSLANPSDAGFVMGFRDSSGKYVVLSLGYQSSNSYLAVDTYSSDTSYNNTPVSTSTTNFNSPLFAHRDLVCKIRNDGTDIYFQISVDGGNNFQTIYSSTITTYLGAATSVCWGCVKNGRSSLVNLFDWTQGT